MIEVGKYSFRDVDDLLYAWEAWCEYQNEDEDMIFRIGKEDLEAVLAKLSIEQKRQAMRLGHYVPNQKYFQLKLDEDYGCKIIKTLSEREIKNKILLNENFLEFMNR